MTDPLVIGAKPAGSVPVVTASPPPAGETPSLSAPAAAAIADPVPVFLEIGTTVAATLVAAAPGSDAPPVGSRFQLRLGGAPLAAGTGSLTGTIVLGASGDTMIEAAIGTLALDRKLALAPGTTIAFQLSGTSEPSQAELPPSQTSGWPALDQALAVLDKTAPDLARQLRAELAPATGPGLAATLLFLAGTVYAGKWPGDAVGRALSAAGQDRLRTKLNEDLGELRRLGGDASTGPWRVLTLPILAGATVQPLRLYLRRKDRSPGLDQGSSRFVIEAELTRLGTLQLDGLVRGNRLDLALRSHAPLPESLRAEASDLFRSASAASGYHGEIVFSTAAAFDVAPLTELRGHVAVQI